jgi:cysteine desulfurase
MKPIYLDYNATTPIDPAVFDAMLPYLRDDFGNPSSAYALGRRAHDAIEHARHQVAALIGARSDEIVFVSGGTEATNIAIRGAAARDPQRRAIVTTTIEHPATEASCALLERDGHPVRRVTPRRDGCVEVAAVAAAIDDATALVTVIHAQNEIGTLQPLGQIAAAAHANGALMHADAAQSAGKVPLDVAALGVDLLTIAGHKLYAPKGIGVLYMRRGLDLPSIIVGAGQEHGRRAGTENVAAIVALGQACHLARLRLEHGTQELAALARELFTRLQHEVPGLVLAGDAEERLPNTLNVLFPGVSGRRVLEACPGVLASTGSACHADREDPSAILLALGIAPDAALGAVRLSLGHVTTRADVEAAAARLAEAWRTVAAAPVAAR